ncbi:MAG TPA: DNA polymerase Y family protein, partial [Stellaceae bacterium]|nr:DNA polymerase Y family protein [Stellaceae bacterium]
MKRVMFIWLRHWPIERRQPRRASPRRGRGAAPLVLATSVGNQRLVSAVDAAAAAEGIAPGMPLADARALHPGLAVAEADFAGDAAALARLAAWCGRYSPWTAPCPPDGVWLDVTGCAHLHGGEDGLMAEALERLARLGIAAYAVIADSAGAAWAVARHGGARTQAVPEGGQRAALADLPVAALRLVPEMVQTLARVGLRRVGDLYAMPRPSLVLRFGADLAARLDQALGALPEPLSPLPPPPLRWARRRFAEPIATAEDIHAATAELLAILCRQLAAEGQGARRLDLTLYRTDGTSAAARIGTAR